MSFNFPVLSGPRISASRRCWAGHPGNDASASTPETAVLPRAGPAGPADHGDRACHERIPPWAPVIRHPLRDVQNSAQVPHAPEVIVEVEFTLRPALTHVDAHPVAG